MARVALRHAREAPIEQWVVDRAAERGVLSIKLQVLFGRGKSSRPDRLFLIPGGRPLFIEFKRPGDPPRPSQEHEHGVLRTLGYQVEVHDDRHMAFAAIVAAMETAFRTKEGRQVLARARRGGLVR